MQIFAWTKKKRINLERFVYSQVFLYENVML